MPDAPKPTAEELARLLPVDPDELRKDLAFALKFNGRKRNQHADGLAADITADHLAKRLEASGYVVMRKPPTQFTVADYRPSLPLKE